MRRMCVCMSENLYPARFKQKSHSRAAVSNKQTNMSSIRKKFKKKNHFFGHGLNFLTSKRVKLIIHV